MASNQLSHALHSGSHPCFRRLCHCGRRVNSRAAVSVRAGKEDPHKVLGVPRGSSREEIRRAYLEQIKLYHPDVSASSDSTETAVQLNAAYQQLIQEAGESGSSFREPVDLFDCPEAEPDCLWINPFACNINPLDWRKLQEVARHGVDPVTNLSMAGVSAPESAVVYLSPGQKADLEEEMADMELSMSFEATAWSVSQKLNRARIGNMRFNPR